MILIPWSRTRSIWEAITALSFWVSLKGSRAAMLQVSAMNISSKGRVMEVCSYELCRRVFESLQNTPKTCIFQPSIRRLIVSHKQHVLFVFLLSSAHFHFAHGQKDALRINSDGYYENRGVNVMLFDDFYPEGHQGGLTIVQAGRRIAANGDVRLEPTPGQWSPVPRVGQRMVDTAKGVIDVNSGILIPARTREDSIPSTILTCTSRTMSRRPPKATA